MFYNSSSSCRPQIGAIIALAILIMTTVASLLVAKVPAVRVVCGHVCLFLIIYTEYFVKKRSTSSIHADIIGTRVWKTTRDLSLYI